MIPAKQTLLFPLMLLVLASGCAHSYYYTPEIAGDGARVGHGGIVYQIPPASPKIKVKLVSLGVVKPPKEAKAQLPAGTRLLQIRMYFVRVDSKLATESLIPSELSVELSDGKAIKPALIHASFPRAPDQDLIPLTAAHKQAVEVFFPLPHGIHGNEDIQSFHFQWTLHYDSNKVETQLARFDREDSAPQQGAEMFPWDSDYPYDESPVLPPGWEILPPYWWWDTFPWYPW